MYTGKNMIKILKKKHTKQLESDLCNFTKDRCIDTRYDVNRSNLLRYLGEKDAEEEWNKP